MDFSLQLKQLKPLKCMSLRYSVKNMLLLIKGFITGEITFAVNDDRLVGFSVNFCPILSKPVNPNVYLVAATYEDEFIDVFQTA